MAALGNTPWQYPLAVTLDSTLWQYPLAVPFGLTPWQYLHDDGSEGFYLLHAAGSEACALVWVEHDQIDLALNMLHQLHKPAWTSASSMVAVQHALQRYM